MSNALIARTVVIAAYLGALLVQGRAEPATALAAVAVVALWALSLLRDTMRHRPATSSAGRALPGLRRS